MRALYPSLYPSFRLSRSEAVVEELREALAVLPRRAGRIFNAGPFKRDHDRRHLIASTRVKLGPVPARLSQILIPLSQKLQLKRPS